MAIASNLEYLTKFSKYVVPLVVKRGWSYETNEDGFRIRDGLDVAGDHWDGRDIDEFFPYDEYGLRNAIALCES